MSGNAVRIHVGRRVRNAAVAAALAAGLVLTVGCTGTEPPARAVSDVPVPDAELPTEIVEQLEGAVDNARAAAGAPAALVTVWVPWAGAWQTALGEATPDGGELSTDMVFRIGEVTRLMTCDVLFAEAERGTVSLDDEVDDYVSSLHLGSVTLRELCDGTSGLGDGVGNFAERVDATPAREWRPRELAAFGLNDRKDPGIEARDSAAAYHVLGMALENATGESMAALIQQHVASPVGLTSTALPNARETSPGDPSLPGFVSSSGDLEDGCSAAEDRTALSPSVGFANSGVTSTIDDLARYGQRVALDARGEAGALADRWARALPIDDQSYAGGGYVEGSLIGQQGRLPGYLTSVYADANTGLTVAVVLNNAAADADLVGALGRELVAIAAQTPAAEGLEATRLELTWTADDARDDVDEAAVCVVD